VGEQEGDSGLHATGIKGMQKMSVMQVLDEPMEVLTVDASGENPQKVRVFLSAKMWSFD
jgi:hypothetical protein